MAAECKPWLIVRRQSALRHKWNGSVQRGVSKVSLYLSSRLLMLLLSESLQKCSKEFAGNAMMDTSKSSLFS